MAVNSTKKAFIVVLAIVFALCLSSALSISTAKADTVNYQTVKNFYDDNKESETLKIIDDGDNFTAFFNVCISDINDLDMAFYQKMQDMVVVCVSYDSFKSSFVQTDYDADDWQKIDKIINDTLTDIIIYDASFSKTELLDVIFKANQKIVTKYLTKKQKFDDFKLECINKIIDYKNQLLYVNNQNPQGSVETVVGFYDDSAVTDIVEICDAETSYLEELVFNTENTSAKLLELKNNAITKLKSVAPNDIIRAVNSIMDYYSVDADETETQENKDLLKNSARQIVAKVKENLIPKLSQDVKKQLSAEISMINTFPCEDFIPSDFDFELKDFIQTEDGAVIIRAVKLADNKAEPISVFPKNASVKVYDSPNGAGRQNASNSIKRKNKNLGVAYFTFIDVYDGSTEWTPVTEISGAKVTYQVEVDLEKYYSSYAGASSQGLLENLFSNVSFLRSKFVSCNKTEEIIKTNDFIKDLADNKGSSLVYYYDRGETTALTYTLTDGGILMFETNTFGTFAGASTSDAGIWLNPIFWIIGIAIDVIIALIVLVIILRNIKYTFKFETFGGSKVKPIKAKLGDTFPMPENPTKEGFLFGGWYLDPDCTVRFIDTSVNKRKNKKVYAKWYEESIPENIVKYYESLRNEILCYGKVGPLGNTGLQEREILAKLFAENDGVYLNVALPVKKLSNAGYDVENDEENPQTPALFIVNDKQTLKQGKEIIAILMGVKGLQNIGPNEEPQPMSLEERQKGYVFAIENDRVAVNISDYFEYLRVYANSFVVYNPSPDLEDGAMLTRMYLQDDCIDLYLALSPRGSLIDASERFEDTPALLKVQDNVEDVQKACEFIDKLMQANGLERRNENSNGLSLKKPKKGCGCGYQVTLN